MFTCRVVLATFCLALVGIAVAPAQDAELREVLKKAIKAHGGENVLLKMKASTGKFKGHIHLNNMKVDLVGETVYKDPSSFRNNMSFEIGGMKIDMIQVYNGKEMWISIAGNVMDIKDEKILNETRDQVAADKAGNLVHLLTEKGVELNMIGEVKVKGADAVGIRVVRKDKRDVNLFFDRKTHLLVKTEIRAMDAVNKGKEVTQEKFFSEYKNRDGLMIPGRMVMEQDGMPFLDFELSEIRVMEDVADTNFVRP